MNFNQIKQKLKLYFLRVYLKSIIKKLTLEPVDLCLKSIQKFGASHDLIKNTIFICPKLLEKQTWEEIKLTLAHEVVHSEMNIERLIRKTQIEVWKEEYFADWRSLDKLYMLYPRTNWKKHLIRFLKTSVKRFDVCGDDSNCHPSIKNRVHFISLYKFSLGFSTKLLEREGLLYEFEEEGLEC